MTTLEDDRKYLQETLVQQWYDWILNYELLKIIEKKENNKK